MPRSINISSHGRLPASSSICPRTRYDSKCNECIAATKISVLYSTLRKIINYIFSLERFDNEKLAKYLRCLLKATLASEPEFPLKIMDDICRLVKQCAGVSSHWK